MKRLSGIALIGAMLVLGTTACDGDFGPFPGVQSLSVVPSDAVVTVGGLADLDVEASTVGAVHCQNSWASSNPAVATVDENGFVTGVSVGTVVVTLTCDPQPDPDGRLSSRQATAHVTVEAP